MSYKFPTAVHPTHLQNFAQRLTQQLSFESARSKLMGVQEAFCKAGGYPDMHAAQQSIKKQNLFFSSTTQYILPTVKTHLLLEWAKKSWAQYKPFLSSAPSEETVKSILTAVWGFESWNDTLASVLSASQNIRQNFLPTGKNLKNLLANSNIYYPLGATADHTWVGISNYGAGTHTLAFGNKSSQRCAWVQQLADYRIQQGDTFVVFCSDTSGNLLNAIKKSTHAAGRPDPVVWNGESIVVPKNLTVDNVATWLSLWIDSSSRNLNDSNLLSWLKYVGQNWIQNRTSSTLSNYFVPSDENSLWSKLHPKTQEQLYFIAEATKNLPITQIDTDRDSQQVYVFNVCRWDCKDPENLLYSRIAHAALSSYLQLMSSEEGNYCDIIEKPRHQRMYTCVSLDTIFGGDMPFNYNEFSMARAFGKKVIHCIPDSSSISENKNIVECFMNKVFLPGYPYIVHTFNNEPHHLSGMNLSVMAGDNLYTIVSPFRLGE